MLKVENEELERLFEEIYLKEPDPGSGSYYHASLPESQKLLFPAIGVLQMDVAWQRFEYGTQGGRRLDNEHCGRDEPEP